MLDKLVFLFTLCVCVAVSAEALMREDFVESGEGHQNIDCCGDTAREVITDAVAEDFESPVKSADDNEDKGNRVNFHTIDLVIKVD